MILLDTNVWSEPANKEQWDLALKHGLARAGSKQ